MVVLAERTDVDVDSGLVYRTGEAVTVRVTHRGNRYDLGDVGAAVRLAGRPAGWREAALAAVDRHALNLNRRGVVFVPVCEGRDIDALVQQVARGSRAVYLTLLDLDTS